MAGESEGLAFVAKGRDGARLVQALLLLARDLELRLGLAEGRVARLEKTCAGQLEELNRLYAARTKLDIEVRNLRACLEAERKGREA